MLGTRTNSTENSHSCSEGNSTRHHKHKANYEVTFYIQSHIIILLAMEQFHYQNLSEAQEEKVRTLQSSAHSMHNTCFDDKGTYATARFGQSMYKSTTMLQSLCTSHCMMTALPMPKRIIIWIHGASEMPKQLMHPISRWGLQHMYIIK